MEHAEVAFSAGHKLVAFDFAQSHTGKLCILPDFTHESQNDLSITARECRVVLCFSGMTVFSVQGFGVGLVDLGAGIVSAQLLREFPKARFLTVPEQAGCSSEPFCADGAWFATLASIVPKPGPLIIRRLLYLHE